MYHRGKQKNTDQVEVGMVQCEFEGIVILSNTQKRCGKVNEMDKLWYKSDEQKACKAVDKKMCTC